MKNTQRASKYQCLSSYQRSPSGTHFVINLKYLHENILMQKSNEMYKDT